MRAAGVEALEALLAKRSFKQTAYRTAKSGNGANSWKTARSTRSSRQRSIRAIILALDEAVPENVNLFTGNRRSRGLL